MFDKFSVTLEPKVTEMFVQLSAKARETLKYSPTLSAASQSITEQIASETTTRSKTMLEDMYSYLSKRVLAMPELSAIDNQNKFYELNLRRELFDKYKFDLPEKGMNFAEASRAAVSVGAGASVGVVGGALIAAIAPTNLVLPVAIIVGAAVAAFCVSYFKAVPDSNKKRFATALDKFLSTVKKDLLIWFDEVQAYFENRVRDLISSF